MRLDRDSCEDQYLVYKEDLLQKTNQGGLICKGSSKTVHVYPSEDRTKCPVRFFSKNINLLLQTGQYVLLGLLGQHVLVGCMQSNVPEELIKEVTGHRSDCVRTYKRTSDELRKEASHTVSNVEACSSQSSISNAKKFKPNEL